MKPALLATKIFLPPVPDYQIQRPRLAKLLDAALHNHQRLVLISAPPGYGKSSLVAAWVLHGNHPAAWVSLETSDNDPARFWSYFLAAIRAYFPEEVPSLLEGLNTITTIGVGFLTELINVLSSRHESLTVVLDDYQAIQNEEIHQEMTYLIEHLPSSLCLVITTRIDPPLILHRWRARGQLGEIRADDLRFSLAEAGEFLSGQMKLELSPADIQTLEERTEGWATGLQLAGLSMQGHQDNQAFIEQFSGSHRFVLDYLMNEVLVRQVNEIQQFLLSTCLLESFCAPLCEKMMQAANQDQAEYMYPGADLILVSLQQANLFLIPLDEQQVWFRYHHLFASFLQQRLKAWGKARINRLHHCAAEWYSDNGLVDEAIHHALETGDESLTTGIVRRHAVAAASNGHSRDAIRWLDALPSTILAANPQFNLLYAWMLVSVGMLNAVEPFIRNARQFLEYDQPAALGEAERLHIMQQITILHSMQAIRMGNLADGQKYIDEANQPSALKSPAFDGLTWLSQSILERESGKFRKAINANLQALPLVPPLGYLAGNYIMFQMLSQALRIQGQLDAAENQIRSCLASAKNSGLALIPASGVLEAELGEIEYERNRVQEARILLEKCETKNRRSGSIDLLVGVALLGARIDRLDGDLPGATFRLEEAAKLARNFGSAFQASELAASLGFIQAEAGNLVAAEAWTHQVAPLSDRNPGYTHGIELLIQARVLSLLGKPEEALILLNRIEPLTVEDDNLSRVIEIRMLQAENLWLIGQYSESLLPLESALAMAANTGHIRIFLDEGSRLEPALAALVASSRKKGQLNLHAIRLKELLDVEIRPVHAQENIPLTSDSLLGIDKPVLTRREMDVLLALAEDLTYPEIATRLVISPGTVKTHISHIYAKLEVEGRLAAVQRARLLQII